MNKEKLLTIRWNNILTIGLGIPTLSYMHLFLLSALVDHARGLIGLAVLGILY